MPHTGKIEILYADDAGGSWSILQAADIASAVGNALAPAGTPRLPHKIKPRRLSMRAGNGGTSPSGSNTYSYQHAVFGTIGFTGQTFGAIVTDGIGSWVIVGFDDEVNNGYSHQ